MTPARDGPLLLLLWPLAILAIGCPLEVKDVPEIQVFVHADEAVVERARWVRVVTESLSDPSLNSDQVQPIRSSSDGEGVRWPVDFFVSSSTGEERRFVRIRVSAYDGETMPQPGGRAPLVEVVALTSFENIDALEDAWLRLDLRDACVGVTCDASDQTCHEGECRGSRFSATPGSSPDDNRSASVPVCGVCESGSVETGCEPAEELQGVVCNECGGVCEGAVCRGQRMAHVAAGADTTCAVTIARPRQLVCWGSNHFGTISPGDATHDTDPRFGPDGATPATGTSPDVVRPPTVLGLMSGSTPILAVGGDLGQCVTSEPQTAHVCAMENEFSGRLKCWGDNSSGKLGEPPPDVASRETLYGYGEAVELSEGYAHVSAGLLHTCGIRRSDMGLECWGDNRSGQVAPGAGEVAPPTRVLADRDWIDVSAGNFHTCALAADGAVYCWGQNFAFQVDVTLGAIAPPTPLATRARFVSLDAGGFSTCAVSTEGEVHCWGGDRFGQLGSADGRLEPGNRGPDVIALENFSAVDVSCGRSHCCALSDDNRVACWGLNDRGQLGRAPEVTDDRRCADPDSFVDYDATPHYVPFRWSAVDCGERHTCGIRTDDGLVYCWGDNDRGQHGRMPVSEDEVDHRPRVVCIP